MRLARFSRLQQPQQRPLTLNTAVGPVTLAVDYGRDRQSGKWICPAREHWGLGPHQKMTPDLEDRICLTAVLAGSYQAAAELSAKWGTKVDDSRIRVHARHLGQQAEVQVQTRWSESAAGRLPVAKTPPPASLLIMMDGWLARQRGRDWELKPADGSRQRVAWHEIKAAVIYRLEQAGQIACGGGCIIDSSALSDLNEIFGIASPDDSPNGEIIITAVPEPTTLAWGSLGGLLSLAAFHQRK